MTISLPKSVTHVPGVISQVPPDYSEQDIAEALNEQGVVEAKRINSRTENGRIIPTQNVKIVFKGAIKEKVTIAGEIFTVRKYYREPYKCQICVRIGHTHNYCKATYHPCPRCGTAHESDVQCPNKCINCGEEGHIASARNCPAYLKARQALRLADEAGTWQVCANKDPHSFVRAAEPTTSADATNAKMVNEIEQLKKEVAELKEKRIPQINKEVASLNMKHNKLQEMVEKKTETILQMQSNITQILEGLNQLKSFNEEVPRGYYEEAANSSPLLESNDEEMDSEEVYEYVTAKHKRGKSRLETPQQ